MKKNFCIIITIIIALFLITACTNAPLNTSPSSNVSTPDTSNIDFTFSDRDKNAEFDEKNSSLIEFSYDAINSNNKNVSINRNIVTISSAGTYILNGNSSNASINVSASKTDKIQLVLNGLTLASINGPAIYIDNADKVFITLADNTENFISDSTTYDVTAFSSNADAAIFSHDDLTINGNGSLTINGNYKHGIVSKDDLIIAGGIININAQKVGLNGKDCIKITDSSINITAGSDGIRSDNTDSSDKGFIYIKNGAINITAKNDGIQAETILKIDNGNITLKTNNGSSSSPQDSNDKFDFNPWFSGQNNSTNIESSKGIKAGSDIIISDGIFDIDSCDDCIHSNSNILINGGKFILKSGDDGIHANTSCAISGGEIQINKSYEGIEGSIVNISGGKIYINSSDDGLNGAGGNDYKSENRRPGQGMFTQSTGEISISGGYIVINADGDGIDSNGSISISGGIMLISGPSDNGNAAIDYDLSASVSGGTIIALGSSNMAQNFSSVQNQGSILCTFSPQKANKSFAIADKYGKIIASFTPIKEYQCAIISTPSIQKGNTYNIITDAEIKNTDENGFAENTDFNDGNIILSLEMASEIYTDGQGSFPGSMKPGSNRPGHNQPGNNPPSDSNVPNDNFRNDIPQGTPSNNKLPWDSTKNQT